MNEKITPVHLSRPAYVYVRQSTLFQVQHRLESQRLQYGLVERARELGWEQVEVIDEDLGSSGSGSVVRQGFERLVAAVCLGDVGAVLSLEASRLARNNQDWQQLVDLCALTNTLIVDQEGIYDSRLLHDRLLLGLKGTMSEFELGLFRQRSLEAIRAKARRGEFYSMVPVGYIRTRDGRCEMDADRRIQQAIRTIFEKFEEMGSVRQVLLWYRQEGFTLPCVRYGPEGRKVEWALPVYQTLHKFLTNPTYAGAYVFGRTVTRTEVVEGRARKRKGMPLGQKEWMVLLPGRHSGYIGWEQYERNRARIRENANMKGLMKARGAARSGRSLVAGLLRCGRCGRKLHVHYGSNGGKVPRYGCRGAQVNHGGAPCLALGGLKIDEAIERQVLAVVEPAAVEAAIRAFEESAAEQNQKQKAKELALEQARYEADRAWRQFNGVEPENRLVAAELERRWNEALGSARALEGELTPSASSGDETPIDRERLLRLGENLPKVWTDERADMSLKKRIVRTLIEEIIVDVDKVPGQVEMIIHWKGGQHEMVQIPRNRPGHHRHSTDQETVDLVRGLAEAAEDKDIARHLNRLGRKTGPGNSWTQSRVASLRYANDIPSYDSGRRKKQGLVNMQEAAQRLGVSPMSVMRLIRERILPARQVIPYAPRLIEEGQLQQAAVQRAVEAIKARGKRPLPENENQKVFDFK